MSEIAQTARVSIVLADYARPDGAGKLSILGAGWQVTALETATGQTAAFTLIVTVDVHPKHYGQEYALEIALLNDQSGELVEAPGPGGVPGPVRISQITPAEATVVAGQFVPARRLWSRSQSTINFAAGIPLVAGLTYRWQVRIDGDEDRVWETTFHVAGPAPDPVIG